VLHTTAKREGKPPAAGREIPDGCPPLGYCSTTFQAIYGLAVDDRALSWSVPFTRVVSGVQTVGGIAKLAGVSRETVRRGCVPVGGIAAIGFAISARSAAGRPLVVHREPWHRLNLRTGLKSRGVAGVSVAEVVEACRQWFAGQETCKTWQVPSEKTGQAPTPVQTRWNKRERLKQESRPRKLKVSLGVNHERATDDVLNGHAQFGYRYRPKSRVTVAVLCSRFSILRRQFYRWKDTLARAERAWLDAAMSGELFPKTGQATDWTPPTADTATDPGLDDVDARLGWNEPSNRRD
jgi:hypothetical protein